MIGLERENYISLVTFRKDGRKVATPVWFASTGGELYVFTMANSGKVKRLRNSSRSQFAACDIRGTVHAAWSDAETHILEDPAEEESARLALRRKYRVQMAVADLFGRLTGRSRHRAYLRVTPLRKESEGASARR